MLEPPASLQRKLYRFGLQSDQLRKRSHVFLIGCTGMPQLINQRIIWVFTLPFMDGGRPGVHVQLLKNPGKVAFNSVC